MNKQTLTGIVLRAMQAKADSDIYGVSHAININTDRAAKAADEILAAISPQAQAGETREKAEAWVWKDGIPAPAQEAVDGGKPIAWLYEMAFYIKPADEQPFRDWKQVVTIAPPPSIPKDGVRNVVPLYASPPAALPAGQVVVTPEMVSAGMAEIPEDGAEYEHVEAAYRKMAALAIPSTPRATPPDWKQDQAETTRLPPNRPLCSCKASQRDGQHMACCPALTSTNGNTP